MEEDRERSCAPVAAPTGIAELLPGYEWARDTVGESGSAVYRLHGRSDAPNLYLKHGRGTVADDVTDEAVRLRWLSRRVPVPQVVCFVADEGGAWLLMTALSGETAWQALERRPDDRDGIVDARRFPPAAPRPAGG